MSEIPKDLLYEFDRGGPGTKCQGHRNGMEPRQQAMGRRIGRTDRAQGPQDEPDDVENPGALPSGHIPAMEREEEIAQKRRDDQERDESSQQGEAESFPNGHRREEDEDQEECRAAEDSKVVASNPVFGDDFFHLSVVQHRNEKMVKDDLPFFFGDFPKGVNRLRDQGGLFTVPAGYEDAVVQYQIGFRCAHGADLLERERASGLPRTSRPGERLGHVCEDSPRGQGNREDVGEEDGAKRRKQGMEVNRPVPASGMGTWEGDPAPAPGRRPNSHRMPVEKEVAFQQIQEPQQNEKKNFVGHDAGSGGLFPPEQLPEECGHGDSRRHDDLPQGLQQP